MPDTPDKPPQRDLADCLAQMDRGFAFMLGLRLGVPTPTPAFVPPMLDAGNLLQELAILYAITGRLASIYSGHRVFDERPERIAVTDHERALSDPAA